MNAERQKAQELRAHKIEATRNKKLKKGQKNIKDQRDYLIYKFQKQKEHFQQVQRQKQIKTVELEVKLDKLKEKIERPLTASTSGYRMF